MTELVAVGPDNVDETSFFCLQSKPKSPGYLQKRKWLEARFKEGLQIQMLGRRDGKRWLYLDAGMFGGLFESTQGLEYELATDRSGKAVPWHVAGPTCDSVDVLVHDQMLPEDLEIGDLVYVRNAGAYTTAYASEFNGFPLPEVKVI